MSRADRLMNGHLVWNKERRAWDTDESRRWPHSTTACDDGEEHRWQPLSFVFETQLLDGDGRVVIRQPALDDARVYCVCMTCRSYTYIECEWTGYTLGGPPSLAVEDGEDEPDDDE